MYQLNVNSMDIKLVNWVKDGKYRIKTLKLLKVEPKLPSELASKLNVNRASMSRILKDLKTKELVDSISSESRTSTCYLTKKGKELVKELGE